MKACFLGPLVFIILLWHQAGETKAFDGTKNEDFLANSQGIVIVGRASLSSTRNCKHCQQRRNKRETTNSGQHQYEMVLKTSQALFGHQDQVVAGLVSSSFPLVGPNYKLVIRDENEKPWINQTVALPNCLFNGTLLHDTNVQVAISTCGQMRGILISDSKQYVMEPLHPNDHQRFKREFSDQNLEEDEANHLVLIYETSDGGQQKRCGLQSKNRKRLHAPDPIFKKLQEEEETDMMRKKRQIENEIEYQKAIEIAVFVDDEVYRKTKMDTNVEDPIEEIQNLVFAYMNSVQLLYQSQHLDTKFRIILVRLEIFKSSLSTLDKKDGNIEDYLESFCTWQSKANPEYWNSLSQVPDHWDHGLLLTGLDLYDGVKSQSSVIGLAWVSGMCHPEYSCTINEGNNFESVYVIAHEMGHNLGMNHDGETLEGNNCDPNRYLMSPVLGPGKVTWSSCSNAELIQFLKSPSHSQRAKCLDDLPEPVAKYDFLRDGKRPGEQYQAIKQCQQSFGPNFLPHVKSEAPFDDLCRELWCSNQTHALRAHPALEGTDCSAKPYPYGSICIEGTCLPFYPQGIINPEDPGQDIEDDNSIDTSRPVQKDFQQLDIIDGRPAWYDPIFTEMFIELEMKFKQRFLKTF